MGSLGGAIAVIVIASLWYGFSRSSGPTVSATLADCSQSIVNKSSGQPSSDWRPVVVGLGSVASIAAIETRTGPAWCFDGMGTGSGGISRASMREALDVPVAVEDGNLNSDVLMLVHLGQRTTSVDVTTASSHSTVLAHGGGFEVLRLPTLNWPHWHAPWSRTAVTLGQIIAYDREGQVTSTVPFTWCPGSINQFFGTGC
jgi:hypothetical protein